MEGAGSAMDEVFATFAHRRLARITTTSGCNFSTERPRPRTISSLQLPAALDSLSLRLPDPAALSQKCISQDSRYIQTKDSWSMRITDIKRTSISGLGHTAH